eukprot:TRINITY_DN4539_c0_g1_i1.p2 TRINITY_DN4539_c0_g1~~TRINITY_DN4539_c0_g1_i1.p2  ORF type:complete len:152 (+),score=44.14 TRINITY_DN4539_c0_g1_i1:137-592(+)
MSGLARVFEILKADHRKMDVLFDKLTPTSMADAKLRTAAFTQLKFLLDTHTQVEEALVYPAFKTQHETMIGHAANEHSTAKSLAASLADTQPDAATWWAKFEAFKAAVKLHVKEEENMMFPQFNKETPAPALEQLGIKVEQMFNEVRQDQK